MAGNSLRNGLIVVLVALGLAACGSAKRFDYEATADEMKPGSGIFSGEDGAFIIFSQ